MDWRGSLNTLWAIEVLLRIGVGEKPEYHCLCAYWGVKQATVDRSKPTIQRLLHLNTLISKTNKQQRYNCGKVICMVAINVGGWLAKMGVGLSKCTL